MELIMHMYPNRYNQNKHRTMFKKKINCKSFLECLNNNNDNNNENPPHLYLHYTRKYDFISKLDKESLEYKKLISILTNNNNEFICIKVGNDKLINEYDVSKTLETLNIPVFMNFHCILECKDNLCVDNKTLCLDVKRDFRGFDPKDDRYAESFPDEINVPVNILVMPYFKYGEIGLNIWSFETLYILKNCLKHMIMALLYASYKLNFIPSSRWLENGGIRDGNLLLGKTDLKSISYGEFGKLEIIDGYYPVINDYHNGGFIDYSVNLLKSENDLENYDWMIYLDIHYIINHITLASECKLPILSFISFIEKLQECYRFDNYSKGITVKKISKEICDMLCHEIDIFEYDY